MRSASLFPKTSQLPISLESTKPTEESSKCFDLSFDNNSLVETGSFTSQSFTQENIAIKLQLLVRSGINTSSISILSTPTPRISEQPSPAQHSLDSQQEEAKFSHNVFPRPSLSPYIKPITFVNTFWSSNEEVRENYIYKLKFQNGLNSDSKKKLQSLILIDWEGTLFNGKDLEEAKASESGKATLASLDETASNLLLKASGYCETFIITSFNEHLVESKTRHFLPLTYQVIKSNNIPVICTRHYEEPTSPMRKNSQPNKQGLFSILNKFDAKVATNVLCMVDSETKVEMMNSFASQFEKSLVKIVKFKEYPKVKELIKQQQALVKELENILFSLRSFTLHLSKRPSSK